MAEAKESDNAYEDDFEDDYGDDFEEDAGESGDYADGAGDSDESRTDAILARVKLPCLGFATVTNKRPVIGFRMVASVSA